MTSQELAILISLGVTVPLLGVSVWVVEEWFPSVAHKVFCNESWIARDWLIVGICCSFISAIFDNMWWGWAWLTRYLHQDVWEWWFDNGVYSNIVFRQGFKLVAGYCHLRAAVETGAMDKQALTWSLAILWLIAACSIFALVLMQP